MYQISCTLTCKCFSDTFLKAVEPVNTSSKPFLLAFNLKNRRPYLLFVWFGSKNINHSFLRALKPLNTLAAPYLTCFCLWRHRGYIVCCILSWIFLTRNWLLAFWPPNTFSVAYFLFSTLKYIRIECFCL